ncbi:uncharacterized protein TrAFT101_006197 [Trichoderma asperellum]|uniref:uncharacterized protein n=1 Tax=Trichoderma asperellum TaxID=101201 RepID=UPI00332F0245|nr:hypothetical protein TrAFT101_006197 [Trichoderma asperellum]
MATSSIQWWQVMASSAHEKTAGQSGDSYWRRVSLYEYTAGYSDESHSYMLRETAPPLTFPDMDRTLGCTASELIAIFRASLNSACSATALCSARQARNITAES